ncbi:MAG TPA: amidohydrolase family protein [Gammaproteobacteria bacterium]|nr:amidohydrolase family protein [Xanthomonadales bacterium]HPI95216.1 amidohydrolase family protein [Gammaproteobacteria bacterium]HPQ87362.1 amidohydrolase family protein [Gammaproteobacteria bacterium]
MKFILLILSFILANTSASADSYIKANAYLDVKSGKLVEPANILIKDGKISAINPESVPQDIKVIELKGQILLPGLMDMHTHLDLDYSDGFGKIITHESASKGAIRATKNAEKTLMAGFTTVRNVGQVHITGELIGVALSEAEQEGWIVSPRIIPAGHMVTISGGHADLTLGLSENLFDPEPKHGVVNNMGEAIEAVRYQIKHGAKVIKIHATAGVMSLEDSVGAQQLSDEEMKAIVEEAERHHTKVAAHAHGAEGIKAAINAGVSSIEHGSLLDDEGIRMMKKHNVFLVPTTGLVDFVMEGIDRNDPKIAAKAKYVLPLAKENLSKAIKAGVKIALGTDSPLIPHGDNAHELSAMMEQGMSELDAIQSATINSAELLGVKDRGQIKQGMLADIIAVSENPLKNIKTLEDVTFVMKGGKVYKEL